MSTRAEGRTPLDPKERIHLLRLEDAQLKARLATAGRELLPALPDELRKLTPQELAFCEALVDA